MNKLFSAIIILTLANILAWYQLNAQFKWTESAFWNNPYLTSIFGIPVGYAFFMATKLCYEYFGFTKWQVSFSYKFSLYIFRWKNDLELY